MVFGKEETQWDLHFRKIMPEAMWGGKVSSKMYFIAQEAQFKQIFL